MESEENLAFVFGFRWKKNEIIAQLATMGKEVRIFADNLEFLLKHNIAQVYAAMLIVDVHVR